MTEGSLALRRTAWSVLSVALAAIVAACSSGGAPDIGNNGPGAAIIADIIACKADADCKKGEACGEGFCQMRRCSSASYTSRPPMGKSGYAYVDRAFVVASEAPLLAPVHDGQRDQGQITTNGTPIDVAGGNLTGARPEPVAYLVDGSSDVLVGSVDGTTKRIPLGWQGRHLATADFDGDGIDDIVVTGATGEYAICNALAGTCSKGTVDDAPWDVATGDIDGNGTPEILFLFQQSITIVDLRAGSGVNYKIPQTSYAPLISTEPVRIAAGDLDGDGIAEIVATEPSALTVSGKLHVYRVGAGLREDQVDGIALSGAASDASMDVAIAKQGNLPVIGVLTNAATLDTFTYKDNKIVSASHVGLSLGAVHSLAAADLAGRSAVVRLTAGPTVEVGPALPIAVLTLPPYSAGHSQGASSATIGSSDESSTSTSNGKSTANTLSLTLGAGVNIPFIGQLGYYMTNSFSRSFSQSKQDSVNLSVGDSYSLSAEPEVDGYDSAGIVLAGGCYHRYDYVVDDPTGALALKSKDIKTYMPVGGESTLWSKNRYNALADAMPGKLPKVAIGYKLGNVASYPNTPTTLDGKPIPEADNVFPKAPITRTSDVGTVSFNLSSSTSATNTEATSSTNGKSKNGSIGLEVFSIQPNFDTSISLDESYSVTVGKSASFSGQVNAVRDDPSTSTNEASLYGYAFQPVVYRQHYKRPNGNDGAFYVLTYATAK